MISIAKQTRGVAFCLTILFLIFGSCGPSLAQSDLSGKNVLILHAHEANAPIFLGTDKGLSNTLQSGGIPSLNQFFESLDLRRNPGPEYRKLLVEQMRTRYSHRKIDMIITMYPEAMEFVQKDCRGVLPDVPVLALYLPQSLEIPETDRRIIGHFPTVDILGTLEIALKLVPGAKRVYVVCGAHEVDRRVEDQARHISKKWEARLEFIYLSHMPFEDMLATISGAPPGSIILALAYSQDVTGENYTTQIVAQRLSQVSTAPIFGILDVTLGHGITGGSLLSFEQTGTKASRLVLDILGDAKTPDNIPAVLDVPSVSMFDWRQLRRWNLNEDTLPEGSIVVNKELALWDFRYYIMGVLAFCLAATALIVFLIVQIRRKNIAEKALKEAEEKYRNIFEGALEGIFETSPEGRFLTTNAALARMLGYESPDEITSTIRDLATQVWVNPGERAQYIQLLEKQGVILNYECQLRRKDGKAIWVSMNTRRVCGPDGRTLNFSGFLEDITERKRAQQELEERLRFESLLTELSARFVNISPEQVDGEIEEALRMILAFFQVDLCALLDVQEDKAFVRVSHAAYGKGVEQVSGKINLTELFPWAYGRLMRGKEVNIARLEDYPEEAVRDRQSHVAMGTKSRLTIPLTVGGRVSRIITVQHIRRHQTWPEEYIPRMRLLGEVFVNALERKRVEEAVRDSEAKYRGLYDSMMDGYALLDMDGRILRYNEFYREMTGYEPDELLRMTFRDITPEKWHGIDQEIIEGQVLTRGYSEVYEKEYRKKDGTVFPVEVRTFLLKNERGDNIGRWTIVRDITGRKEMESEARKLKDDLAHVTRVSTLGGLTGALAHEINQPLAAILSNAQAAQRFLSQDNPDMKEISEILGDIIRDDNRAAEVIRKTRSLLKKEESRYESLDLNDVIEEILNVIRNDTLLMTVSIEKEMAPSLPSIWGDRIQLQQVILNLVLNAAEAMKEADPALRRMIVRTSRHDDRFAKVSIRDFGPGIRENHDGRLFAPFYTTKTGGLGMGLAISQDIVKSHKGVIWGENNADAGATFTFTVPFDKGMRS